MGLADEAIANVVRQLGALKLSDVPEVVRENPIAAVLCRRETVIVREGFHAHWQHVVGQYDVPLAWAYGPTRNLVDKVLQARLSLLSGMPGSIARAFTFQTGLSDALGYRMVIHRGHWLVQTPLVPHWRETPAADPGPKVTVFVDSTFMFEKIPPMEDAVDEPTFVGL
jgi:hypothetical protein